MQRHTLSVTRIQSHEGFTAHELCWPARKSIPKLEHRISQAGDLAMLCNP
jgi:hypothetical protein